MTIVAVGVGTGSVADGDGDSGVASTAAPADGAGITDEVALGATAGARGSGLAADLPDGEAVSDVSAVPGPLPKPVDALGAAAGALVGAGGNAAGKGARVSDAVGVGWLAANKVTGDGADDACLAWSWACGASATEVGCTAL